MYKTLKFDLGRNALRYLVRTHKIEELHIPYYLCDVIRHVLFEEGCKPIFYHIDENFYPVKKFHENDYILYPNYFGICADNINRLGKIYPKLITDNAHAYFDNPSGIASFNAGHKFGYKESLLQIKTDDIQETEIFYKESEKEKYRNLFRELHLKYSSSNLLTGIIGKDAVSFVYPYLAENEKQADELVKELKKEAKTVYRYWNAIPKSYPEYKFYSALVPIPVLA